MEEKKKRTVLKALSGFHPDDRSVTHLAAIRAMADSHRITPSMALRLVQFNLVSGYHDHLSSGQPVTRSKPVRYEICFGKACLARGAREILQGLERLADSPVTDPARKPVKIKTCSCLHRCSKGPVVRVDGILHEKFPIPE
ncbi:MAG: (2Fe-2S) ferredoxin domain-containing protein [Clostridia bacterium]|nr:(2Fe-2S) ferredoxin domain-containing protein [Clostridia bacterium]NCC74896.1 (2Fe-2S) ferredoxin domain-containing protein [Clostridia bacterium]